MCTLKSLCAITVAILAFTCAASARFIHPWTYQQLTDKSDLIVIAKPASTNDTAERASSWQGFSNQSVIGVETKFTTAVVLKGDKNLNQFTLHHYRADGVWVANGPMFISFDPTAESLGAVPWASPTYILFLTKESDGRYAAVAGQVDPELAIKKIDVAERRPTQIHDILTECKTIQPGMHRSELLRVFTTEGGLSTAEHRTYVHRNYPLIKVDVDFTLSEPKQSEEKPADIIKTISKPYLDWSIND